MKCIKSFCRELYEGWLLAIHIDTRAIEFNSGIMAILVGIIVILPPNNYHMIAFQSIYWGWVYVIYGLLTSIFSVYGPYTPRKYLSLVGVAAWSFMAVWLWNSEHIIDNDDLFITLIPYVFFTLSSAFTYLGLWRYPSKWNYYYEPPRVN